LCSCASSRSRGGSTRGAGPYQDVAAAGSGRPTWNAAPGHLDLAGHAVHLQGFASPDLPTVVVIADSGRRVTVQVVPPESDSATAAQAMMAATHQYAEHDTDARVTKAETAEANSLDEVAARLARLPGNTGPEQAALICGWVGEAAAQFSDADPGVRPDPRRAHRPRTHPRQPRRSPRPQQIVTTPSCATSGDVGAIENIGAPCAEYADRR
jgi:hypothetical protein